MGRPKKPERVKLIAGLIYREAGHYEAALARLQKRFGRIDFESEPVNFDATDYYHEEFGGNLKRRFVSFFRTAGIEGISRAKLITNSIEARLSLGGKRQVNIDPGYLDLSKLVLFTTKDYAHRLYLSGGIYGEVTLLRRNSTYVPVEWTYPDYRTKACVDIFNRIRGIFREQLRCS